MSRASVANILNDHLFIVYRDDGGIFQTDVCRKLQLLFKMVRVKNNRRLFVYLCWSWRTKQRYLFDEWYLWFTAIIVITFLLEYIIVNGKFSLRLSCLVCQILLYIHRIINKKKFINNLLSVRLKTELKLSWKI